MAYQNQNRQYREDTGMEMLRGAQMFANIMGTGADVQRKDMEIEDAKGVNAAYEHIAGKVGQGGDISSLDGDPILNTRYGTMAAGKFLGQRAQNEESRMRMLKGMEGGDDHFYQNTFRPLAFAADEAFKAGDMQRFGTIANELSAKSPLPYKTELDSDGNFRVMFRSDQHGGWTDTGRRMSPQEVMQEIGGIMSGEQKILAGANMQERIVNPRFLATAARNRIGTIAGNAENMADPNKWIALQKGGHTVYAIPQNRHDNYSVGPSYKIVDDSGKTGGMVDSLEGLANQGYVPRKKGVAGSSGTGGGRKEGKPPTVAQLNAAGNQNMKVLAEEEGIRMSGGQWKDMDGEPVDPKMVSGIRQRAMAMAYEQYGVAPQQKKDDTHHNNSLGLGLGQTMPSHTPQGRVSGGDSLGIRKPVVSGVQQRGAEMMQGAQFLRR